MILKKILKKNIQKQRFVKKFGSFNRFPSDFGFNNILKKNNKIYFIDFEYAGLMIH